MRSLITQTVAVAVVCLALAEGVLHAGGSSLGTTQEWYVAGVEELVEAMDALEAAGIASDLAFAGTSLVMLGLRTEVVEQELESIADAHNVGLPDGVMTVQRRWLLEVAVPRLRPERVVWGLASLDFNGGRPVETIDLYEQARAGKAGLFGPLDRALSRVSLLSYYRQYLRGPLFVRNLFGEPPTDVVQADQPLESLMNSVAPWPILEKTQDRFDALRASLVADFHIGEREAEDFEFTLDTLIADGVEVVLVLMPVPTEYIAANNDGRESFESWTEYVNATAAARAIPVYDYSRFITDDHFADYNHVDEEAAWTLTRTLVEDLRGLGW